MIRSSPAPSFLYNDKLKLDASLKAAKTGMSLGVVSTGLKPGTFMPPAGHVPHVIVVGGPGQKSFRPPDVAGVARGLARIASHCELVVSEQDVPDVQCPVRTQLLSALRASSDRPTLLVFRAHGIRGDNGHFEIVIDAMGPTSGTLLFQDIGASRRAPVEIVMSSCHGRGGLEGVRHLPEGSVVVVFAPEGQPVLSDDVRTMNAQLGKLKCLSALGMLLLYCACALTATTPPSVFMRDGSIIDLQTCLDSTLGKRVAGSDRALIHQQLDHLLDAERVNEGIHMLESLPSSKDIPRQQYGLALAIAAVLSGIVVDPNATASPVPDPVVHNLIRHTVDFSHAPRVPQLNLKHEGVKAMLKRRGSVIRLPDQSEICFSPHHEHMLLKAKGETAVARLQKLEGCEVFKVKAIEGTPEAIAHFQQNGVLQAVAAPASRGTSFTDLV
jgi:hypothetical protein